MTVSRSEFIVRRYTANLMPGLNAEDIDLSSTYTALGYRADILGNLVTALNDFFTIGMPGAAGDPAITVSSMISFVQAEVDRQRPVADLENYAAWLAGVVG